MDRDEEKELRDRYLVERLSWPTVERHLEEDTDTALIPVGAVEQHGPHLPLGTDAMLGEALACRIAHSMGRTLVAPVVSLGCSTEHMSFPGTMSVPQEVLRDQLRANVRSLEHHGFTYAVLLPTHGGNIAPINAAAPELANEFNDIDTVPVADLHWYMELLNRALREAGVDIEEPIVHAGAAETALMLALYPSLVDTDAAASGHEGDLSYARLLRDGMEGITENGVLGDPTVATSQVGEHMVDVLVDEFADRIRSEIRSLDPDWS
jgi:creatinine amidohydrolase